MEHKNIVATIYLKNGQAVKGMDNFEPMGWDVISLARLYNDSGIDKIIILISQTMTKNTRRISIPSKYQPQCRDQSLRRWKHQPL